MFVFLGLGLGWFLSHLLMYVEKALRLIEYLLPPARQTANMHLTRTKGKPVCSLLVMPLKKHLDNSVETTNETKTMPLTFIRPLLTLPAANICSWFNQYTACYSVQQILMNFLQFGSWLASKLSDELLYNQESSTTDLSTQDFFSPSYLFSAELVLPFETMVNLLFNSQFCTTYTVNLFCKIYWS